MVPGGWRMSARYRGRAVGRADRSGSGSSSGRAGVLVVDRSVVAGGGMVLVVRGEVDYATAGQVRAAISAVLADDPVPAVIVLDLAGVTALDSIGVGTLVVGYRICAQLGVRLVVRDATPFVAGLLRVAGVADQLSG